ncbi:type I-E CRISPR-associated protein Cas6/Cse3/CasE [Alkalimarinus coralli]|uniref:type I-E CRISPR-associated protein Cas6/Cse3/CasE n=1 Tax=Alkalimarinus coralli TaxID=2935863 RepID=UPI00202B294D|nr:type I-E CRISPR-associated protein Cas6/Cse3/CasE [Alkalimarinus coralli]
MFLSKISLLQSTQAARELIKIGANGAYASHQLLWQLFTDEEQRNFLFREEMSPNGLPQFFVLSKVQPENNHALFNVQTKVFQPKIAEGQRLGYKLRVNPTICVKGDNGKSKRHDVLMHAKYQAKKAGGQDLQKVQALMEQAAQAWISDEQRLQRWGIQLDAIPEIERYTQHRSQKKSGNQLQFSSVDFQGLLTVKDPSIFMSQYANGFGRAKALGCGLMLIRRV